MDFPHLNDSRFPDLENVDVYKYKNELDYSRFDDVQMQLTLCTVPWDMGEAHVGNRTISGIGNVVHFGNKKTRDKWFSDLKDSECFRFSSKYKSLQRDNEIIVPVPFDVASNYNYLYVHYPMMANNDSPVQYESRDGRQDWFWFIREVEFLAPNSTKLHLLPDAWQTFIYDVTIPYMVLERGHAPLFASNVDAYLANPIDNSRYLLAPDVNFGAAPEIAKHESEVIINGADSMAVIVTTSNPQGTWGTQGANTWATPDGHNVAQGTLAYRAIACAPSSLQTLFSSVNNNIPQFMQTIKAVFFVSRSLLVLGTSFTFQGVTCYPVGSDYVGHDLYTLTKADFGFDSHYRNLAKLYTYPYSVLEVYNTDGSTSEIRIEDTSGKLRINTALNLVYPWIRLNGHIIGTGKAPVKSLSFTNIDSRTVGVSGNWLDLLIDFDIPTFGVTQSAAIFDNFNTHYTRRQMGIAASNASASATAAINCDVAVTGYQTSANSDITAIGNAKAADDTDTNNFFNLTTKNLGNNLTVGTSITQNIADQVSASIAQSKSVVDGLLSGNIGSALSGLINTAYIAADTNVGINLRTSQGQMNNNYNDSMTSAGNSTALALLQIAVDAENDKLTTINKQLNDSLAARNTRDAAIRDNAYNTATSEITNLHAQNSLGAPMEFGSFSSGQSAPNRPSAIYCVVKTQREGEIAMTGDEFLRYGYSYSGNWRFDGNWNIGRYFTFWKLSDFWVKGLNVPDLYMDRLRFFLFGGVTVWRSPEDIGKVSIYENGV